TGIKGASGPVPVTLMTAAPAFVVKVDIQCIRNSAVAIDQEMTSWQIRTYERLLQAYRTASRNYAEQLALRIAAASAGHTGEVQRNALRQSCLELLAPGGAADPQQYRFLDPLFSWAAMSWHYEPWHASASGAWPERTPGEKSQPKSEHLFELFLRAPSARVLLPVEPGCEAWLLFYLQYGLQWVGGPGSEPVTSSCVLLLEEIHAPERLRMRNRAGHFEPVPALLKPDCPRSWTVRVPTSMLYLQDDASLPHFHEHDRSPLPLDPGTGSAP
ncbi:MAG TPA: hypothetical protein VFG03_05540, partial [Telluria sp.]|nr:hypothetical protein [Telluria sp.]